MSDVTFDEANRVLSYNPTTGEFTYKIDLKNGWKRGTKAGSSCGRYSNVRINDHPYLAHRIAWLLHYGKLPRGPLDHINHNPHDNRICNLREASHQENSRNKTLSPLNTSGITGVCWDKTRQKWQARITVDGKLIMRGRHTDFFEACCARKALEVEHDFHPNHGRQI